MLEDEAAAAAAAASDVADAVVLSRDNKDVLPPPMPIAGTFPTSLPVSNVEAAACVPVLDEAAWATSDPWPRITIFSLMTHRFAGALARRTMSGLLISG